MRARGLTAVVVLLLIWPAAWAPGRGEDRQRRLVEIRREIETREAKARDYAEEAEGVFEELDAIDRQLAETRRSVRLLRERQRSAEKELEGAKAGLIEARSILGEVQKDLEKRLVALYKFGRTGGVPALYSANDFQSFARRRQGLTRVLEQDAVLFERHRQAQAAWERQRDHAQSLIDEIREARDEIQPRDETVRRNLVERRNLLTLLRSRSDQETRAADELRQAAARLESALESMTDGELPSGAGLKRGKVPWPVSGSVRGGFGQQVDPEFGTQTRRSGIEIESKAGVPVRAVADGRVLFAGWFRGYGQLVILDHGKDSLTVSGYLDRLSVEAGESIRGGQVIGTVGETGSLSGPGLYFEVRHAGQAVDPRAWLASGKEGT